MKFKKINYESNLYKETLTLRNEVMYLPFKLDISNKKFENEKNDYIIGSFDKNKLIGVGILNSHKNNKKAKVEYLCVNTKIQQKGIGSKLLNKLEEIAKHNNNQKIVLEARYSAKGFYKKSGYHTISDIYYMKIAPIKHIKMIKNI